MISHACEATTFHLNYLSLTRCHGRDHLLVILIISQVISLCSRIAKDIFLCFKYGTRSTTICFKYARTDKFLSLQRIQCMLSYLPSKKKHSVQPLVPTLYYITALFNNFRRSSYKLFATYIRNVCIYIIATINFVLLRNSIFLQDA